MVKDRSDPIRVVVIDDSPTVRDMLVAILQNAQDVQVVGAGSNGEEALRLVSRLKPDVVTMDVRMPKMDGLEATRRIMRDMPTRIVIVADSMMHADMDLTFEALKAGALTAVRKPGLQDPETCDKVVQTVRLMADVPVIHHWGRAERQGPSAEGRLASPTKGDLTFNLRNSTRFADLRIVGVASSTGGPAALASVLGALPAGFGLPILVAQHITPGFAVGLAEWLNSQTPLSVRTAGHGEMPKPGTVLIAPDDYHLQVNLRGVVELVKEPPYKGLRPSANYLFKSLARAFGSKAMGIILTGMGDDGVEGLEALHLSGGLTIAQDEESCVVYGMPREAVARNTVDQVLTLDQIARTLADWHVGQQGGAP
jgi:two-component system, chemotaxis family, protein-glutamate methylesterase/glutaminase